MGTKMGTRDTLVLAKQEGPTRVEVPPRGSSVRCLAGHCRVSQALPRERACLSSHFAFSEPRPPSLRALSPDQEGFSLRDKVGRELREELGKVWGQCSDYYCYLTNFPKPGCVKQQPFHFTHSFVGQEFGRAWLGGCCRGSVV